MHFSMMVITLLTLVACKTSNLRSNTEAWALDGSEEKARQFVAHVVKSYYGGAANDQVVEEFAREITDRKTKHNEAQEYVLAAKEREGRAALERYIVLEFAVSTNLFEVGAGDGRVQYLGPNGVKQN